MKRLICVALLGVTLMPVGLAETSFAGTVEYRRCSEHRRRVSRLEASGVACSKARWVAARFDRKVMDEGHWPGDGVMRVGRFRCRARQTSYETYRIRCVRAADEVVRFRWGV